jgi:hypothetical protein
MARQLNYKRRVSVCNGMRSIGVSPVDPGNCPSPGGFPPTSHLGLRQPHRVVYEFFSTDELLGGGVNSNHKL